MRVCWTNNSKLHNTKKMNEVRLGRLFFFVFFFIFFFFLGFWKRTSVWMSKLEERRKSAECVFRGRRRRDEKTTHTHALIQTWIQLTFNLIKKWLGGFHLLSTQIHLPRSSFFGAWIVRIRTLPDAYAVERCEWNLGWFLFWVEEFAKSDWYKFSLKNLY